MRTPTFSAPSSDPSLRFNCRFAFLVIPITVDPVVGWLLLIVCQTGSVLAFLQLWRRIQGRERSRMGASSVCASARALGPPLAIHVLNGMVARWRLYPVTTVHLGRLGCFAALVVLWAGAQARAFAAAPPARALGVHGKGE